MKAFREALALNPDDAVSEMYIRRCEYLKANPPGEAWEGVWVMHTK